jgi:uncharacterized membrane-anchored protein
MKKLLLWGNLLVVLVSVNVLIVRKERAIASGRTMFLELAPVDPRSLMQGDYMNLRYLVAQDAEAAILERRGRIVVTLDTKNVAEFARVHRGEPLAAGEYLLAYEKRDGLHLGAESFLFQEGDAEVYAQARYGELKVAADGASVLVGLRNGTLQPLLRTKAHPQDSPLRAPESPLRP